MEECSGVSLSSTKGVGLFSWQEQRQKEDGNNTIHLYVYTNVPLTGIYIVFGSVFGGSNAGSALGAAIARHRLQSYLHLPRSKPH